MPSAALLARAATTGAADTLVADAAPAIFEDEPAEASRVVHRVRAGETLFSIARRYQTTIEHLKAVNNLRSSVLQIGARLIVQTGRTLAAQQQQ
jgi:membrane-bound lytic murein transglycosylase D